VILEDTRKHSRSKSREKAEFRPMTAAVIANEQDLPKFMGTSKLMKSTLFQVGSKDLTGVSFDKAPLSERKLTKAPISFKDGAMKRPRSKASVGMGSELHFHGRKKSRRLEALPKTSIDVIDNYYKNLNKVDEVERVSFVNEYRRLLDSS
jgi:hypothetical protein